MYVQFCFSNIWIILIVRFYCCLDRRADGALLQVEEETDGEVSPDHGHHGSQVVVRLYSVLQERQLKQYV